MIELSQTALIAAWFTTVGAVVGSFLNVVIARVPRGQSIVRPGSRCPRCKTPIHWYDNVPILSWILLRARCRACRAPISARYPLVEALVAGAAWLAWHRHGLSGAAAAELAVVAALLALAFIDLDTCLLPNVITWPLIVAGPILTALGVTTVPSLKESLYGAGVGFAVFAAVSWIGAKVFRKEALGFGDVWLLSGLGACLGVKALLPVILFASLQGSVIGILLLKLRRESPEKAAEPLEPADPSDPDWKPDRHHVPFGPFLVAGALEWLYLADAIARWVPTLEIFR